MKRIFTAGGKPFFPLGAQARNSSGYNDAESDTAFRAVKLLHGNMLEIPVYWEQIEPEEGTFDFAAVDALLSKGRQYDIRLVLLWFGTWKNGQMDYVPAWVKKNPQRFQRVVTPSGKSVFVLSSHCRANVEADCSAFTALCGHLKAVDGSEHTVIALQIENEPGILGSDRDYGPDGQAAFTSPIPSGLVSKMEIAGKGRPFDLWQQAGGRAVGTWGEVFGWAGGEMMTAWSIATYIDRLAAAGKAILDIPMYINVWLGEQGWMVPGEGYPSGGAVGKTLDMYKWFAPHIDVIAPDIYIADLRGYENICKIYTRDDNPLFVPESGFGGANIWNMFRAIGQYDAIGYAFFSAEYVVAEDGTVRPEYRDLVDSFRCAASVLPLLLTYQGTGKVHAIVQEENMGSQQVPLDGWLGLAEFHEMETMQVFKDWRHPPQRIVGSIAMSNKRGRGLVIQASKNELYVTGANFRLVVRPKLPPAQALDMSVTKDYLLVGLSQFVAVDEGHFDDNGAFVTDHRRNGDEVDHGLWVEPDCGVLRVILCE
jgi:hypothetical protein